ncbi:MAG TPA: O-antigen ligase family protein [Bacteroidota bacterium]|nr:O-antigen ligase family protein [Bacteroidota bacterium]
MRSHSMMVRVSVFGILLFAFSIPVSHVPAQFAIAIAFLGWIAEGVAHHRWQMRWHPMFWALIAYLAWNTLAAGISERPMHSLGAVLDNEWPLFIMLMMYWIVDNEKDLQRIVQIFLLVSSVAMLYALWQVVGGVEFYRHKTLDSMGWGFYRAVGFYGFYLTFAALAMTVFFIASAYSLEFKKWYTTALSGISFLAVLGTFARSMWLSFGAAIPLLAFSRGKKMGIAVTGILFLIIVGGILTVPAIRYRAESIIEPGQNETRLNLWKTAIKVGEHNPLTGVGEDNWDLVFDRYRVEGYYDTTVHPHNDYLTVLVSSGVPGLAAFLSMWGVVLFRGFRTGIRAANGIARAAALGGTFALIGLMIGGMFQNYYGTFINCLEWWFVVGLILSAEKLETLSTDPVGAA